jgi:putative peptidoglycan lipid II flippase
MIGQNSTNSEKSPALQPSVISSALRMASGTMASRVLGLVRDQLFLALFPRHVTDAWTAAFRLPNMFRRLLGEGSLSVSFIPIFVEARHLETNSQTNRDSNADSKNFVNSMALVLFVFLTALTALGILFSKEIMGLMLDQNFKAIPGQFELAVRMCQIMFGFIFLMSFYAFFMGILNALGIYGLPAMAPVFFNIAMIVANFLPHDWFPVEGDALAWGVLVGGFLQLCVLIPKLIEKKYFPKIAFQKIHPRVFAVLRNMLPGFVGMGLLQITTFINTHFASSLEQGTLSSIYAADRLLELPLSLISVSLGTALLPTLAAYWSSGEKEKMMNTLQENLLVCLFVGLPCAMGLFVLAEPIITLLFKYNKFSGDDVARTALVLQIYSLILLSASSVRIITPCYYAIQNTWFPAAVSLVCLIFHIIAAPFLMDHYGLSGLVFSTFLSGFLNLILLTAFLGNFLRRFDFVFICRRLALFAIPTLFMGAVCSQFQYLRQMMTWIFMKLQMNPSFLTTLIENLVVVGGAIFIGVIVFSLISHLLDIPEYRRFAGAMKRRFLK